MENLVTLGIDTIIVYWCTVYQSTSKYFAKEFRRALILQMKPLMADCRLLLIQSRSVFESGGREQQRTK